MPSAYVKPAARQVARGIGIRLVVATAPTHAHPYMCVRAPSFCLLSPVMCASPVRSSPFLVCPCSQTPLQARRRHRNQPHNGSRHTREPWLPLVIQCPGG